MREKMEDVRGPRFKGCADLTAFHLLSTGNSLARGANSLLSTCLICVKDLAADVMHLSTLSSAVSLSVNFFQPTQLSDVR